MSYLFSVRKFQVLWWPLDMWRSWSSSAHLVCRKESNSFYTKSKNYTILWDIRKIWNRNKGLQFFSFLYSWTLCGFGCWRCNVPLAQIQFGWVNQMGSTQEVLHWPSTDGNGFTGNQLAISFSGSASPGHV